MCRSNTSFLIKLAYLLRSIRVPEKIRSVLPLCPYRPQSLDCWLSSLRMRCFQTSRLQDPAAWSTICCFSQLIYPFSFILIVLATESFATQKLFTIYQQPNVSASPISCLVLCEAPSRDMHRHDELGLACFWLCLLVLLLSRCPPAWLGLLPSSLNFGTWYV